MPFVFMPMLLSLLVLGGAFMLAARFVRAYEQRNSGGREIGELRDRIARLEDSLESMTAEVRRLSDAQHFTTQLLEGRKEPPETPAG